jgi:hypothetical protein
MRDLYRPANRWKKPGEVNFGKPSSLLHFPALEMPVFGMPMMRSVMGGPPVTNQFGLRLDLPLKFNVRRQSGGSEREKSNDGAERGNF